MSSSLYSEIQVSTDVMSASNHQLIQMLMDKCLQQLANAKRGITENQKNKKYQAIHNAIDIVGYLRNCLNFDDPEVVEMAKQLDQLYEFLEKCLLHATLKNQTSYLEDAEVVLRNIKSGWDTISPK